MTRLPAFAAVLAAASLAALPALAQNPQPPETVAGAFMAAAQAQDRQAVLQLLDKQVSIRFPGQGSSLGSGQGQPFVIGYLDGLFYGERAVSLDSGSAPRAGAIRFMAHDAQSHDRYAIDVEVRNARVVRVTVNVEPESPTDGAVAAAVAS